MRLTDSRHRYAWTSLCIWAIGVLCLMPTPATGSLTFPEEGVSEELRTIGIFQKLAPATLFLSVTYDSAHPLAAQMTMGVGAGFIVDDSGRALTSAHVVDSASTITATLYDGQEVDAQLLGFDPISDVAVLQLVPNGKAFVPVKLGDSSHLHVGQRTLVVGNPFGLGFTLTDGIISGLGFGSSGVGPGQARLIQTTAPINPGNSGGPLVDSHGRVIGMMTIALMGAQNIGFAIPTDVAKDILAELHERGTIERPWLGITGQFVTDEVMQLLALPLTKGLLVVDVDDGSPADEAGLCTGTLHMTIEKQGWVLGGDIIVTVGGQTVSNVKSFIDAMKALHVGQKVPVELVRNGTYVGKSILVGKRPSGSLKQKHRQSRQAPETMFSGLIAMPHQGLFSF